MTTGIRFGGTFEGLILRGPQQIQALRDAVQSVKARYANVEIWGIRNRVDGSWRHESVDVVLFNTLDKANPNADMTNADDAFEQALREGGIFFESRKPSADSYPGHAFANLYKPIFKETEAT